MTILCFTTSFIHSFACCCLLPYHYFFSFFYSTYDTMASFGLGRPATTATNTPQTTATTTTTTTSGSGGSSNIDSSTPWMAASEGNLALLQSSLAALNLPAGANAADENGYTLVHAAASYNQLEILQFLILNQGANVHAADNDGDTALHHAGNVQSVQFLIQHGKANPHQTNGQGKTALQAKQEELEEMMQDEDIEDDDDELEALREVVQYLTSILLVAA